MSNLVESKTLEKLYKKSEIKDYAYDEGEDGCFYWVLTNYYEWLPLVTFLEKHEETN